MIDVLGFDLGGVVVDRKNGGREPSFEHGNYLLSPEIPGAIDALAELRTRFGPMMYGASKAHYDYATKSLAWLAHKDFHRRTNIGSSKMHFFHDRAAKAPFCEKFCITHFIDDRVETMEYLLNAGRTMNLMLFLRDGMTPPYIPSGVQVVRSWHEVRKLLLQ